MFHCVLRVTVEA